MDTSPETDQRAASGTGGDDRTGVGPRPYPVVLHLGGAPCLVVGAGPVAARRTLGLLEAGAAVTVVAPSVGAGVRALAGDGPPHGTLALEVRPYAPPEASAYRLVVAATGDPAVDDQVTADAFAGGALVNRPGTPVDGPGRGAPRAGTVLVPAVHRAGTVTVAVSTDGTGPALAGWLRDRVAAGFDGADVATLAGLVGEARSGPPAGRGPGPAPGGAGGGAGWTGVLDRVAPLVAGGRADEARELLAHLLGGAAAGPSEAGRNGR
jgi:siroheme synthase-like protein